MKIILSFILFFSFTAHYSQINYSSEKHHIIISDEGVFEQVTKTGAITKSDGHTFSIHYVELEKIENVVLTYFDKKIRKVKQKEFITTAIPTSSFYAGVKALQFNVDLPTRFHLSYQIKRDDLMFLSTINFRNRWKCDSIIYQIDMPSNNYLYYNIPHKIERLVIDSIFDSSQKKYSFSLINHDSKPLSELEFSNSNYIISKNLRQSIRLLISPSNTPNKVLNDWYLNLIKNVGELNQITKSELDMVLKGLTDQDTIIKTLYQYIQNKIKYLDIEDGISAFKPRDVNDILYKNQGDCKDMSNLLTQALVYKGFDARMALSSSLSHSYDLDFPNIASANHVVCVVKRQGKWIVLDATDKYCNYLNPSSHVQGRAIFITGKENGFFYNVNKIPYQHNLDSSYTNFIVNNDGELNGKLTIKKEGLANRRYYSSKDYYKTTQFENWFLKDLERTYKFFNIEALEHQIDRDSSFIQFSISNKNNNSLRIKNKHYLPLNKLLPYPHHFPKNIEANEKLITYQTIYKKGVVQLKFENDITLLKSLNTSYDQGPLTYNLSTEILNNRTIELKFILIIDEVELQDELAINYNKLNAIIIEIMKKSIIYATKDL